MVADSNPTVLYDKTFTTKDGQNIRIVLDLNTILSDVEAYRMALLDARGLPYDIENLPARDPIILLLVKQNPKQDAKAILRTAQTYYRQHIAEAVAHAHLLAFFAENPLLTNEPAPYDPPSIRRLPGIVDLPPITKNLSDPSEYRLKQILDLLMDNPEIMAEIDSLSREMSVRLEQRVQEMAFRQEKTGRKVRKAAVASDVQPEIPEDSPDH